MHKIGDPRRYEGSFWLDVDSRPYMRALVGKELNPVRLRRSEGALQVFAEMLRSSPHDNQDAQFIVPELDAGVT